MSRPFVVSQQKLAEKLTVLKDRGVGMLTRIYNIKKGWEKRICFLYRFKKIFLISACGDTKSKPSFLSDKSLESSIKTVVRKFPNVDLKSLSNIHSIRGEIVKSLSLYYYTFVDLLDFKDHVNELLTTIDACQISLDITVNFHLTSLYLELVTIYIQLMILLSRVDDRKAVLGLFNAAYEMSQVVRALLSNSVVI